MSAATKLNPQHPFLDRDVILSLANGVTETLQTMAQTVANFEKPFVAKEWQTPCQIAVFLELNADPYHGQVRFHFDSSVARGIIDKMLGPQVEEMKMDEILDGVGEISNIFFGLAKTKLNTIGFKLNMSTPYPCQSADLPAIVGEKTLLIIPFRVEQALCYVELILY
ncbi:MAG: hypothetical protein A2622_07680 [Bdellovibrionales bacterium RIFCSPHIGHO2_01_FULL_40_29]|nr:MAG: hypothetical protein A2622_07680 [Bdellovibrionales bacterium RIFCSPHIGHO2_01_FULL_40_29]OFZ34199.1 MAG: hypothetical protein A3D17_03970 [Bdellovibrionales bacterium RIFCSPHIGHO2_02_FULL_40_15]